MFVLFIPISQGVSTPELSSELDNVVSDTLDVLLMIGLVETNSYT
jgi:hypothetical protein